MAQPSGYPPPGYPPVGATSSLPPPPGNPPVGGPTYPPHGYAPVGSYPPHGYPPVGNLSYPPHVYPQVGGPSSPAPPRDGYPHVGCTCYPPCYPPESPSAMPYTPPPPAPVTPYGRVCVVGLQYVAPFNVDLIVDEKCLSLSGGDYIVKDVDNNPIFTVKGKVFSLHKHRSVYDMRGKPIVTVRARILTAHHRWSVYRGCSEDEHDMLFEVRQSHMIQLQTKLHVFLKGNDTEDACDFRVEGSFLKRNCTIYVGHTNNIIAQMHTKLKLTGLLFGKNRFAITVYANVDQAFITALIVLLDEINEAR